MAKTADKRIAGTRARRRRPRVSLGERVDALEAKVRDLEARMERLEAPGGAAASEKESASCCDDLIGCLDDCMTDVGELRKKVRDVRS